MQTHRKSTQGQHRRRRQHCQHRQHTPAHCHHLTFISVPFDHPPHTGWRGGAVLPTPHHIAFIKKTTEFLSLFSGDIKAKKQTVGGEGLIENRSECLWFMHHDKKVV